MEIQKQNISQQTWDLIQMSMHKVVTGPKGTGWRSDPKIPGLKISGKTSTAENPHGDPHAWFIAYGEKDDEMISVVVMVENSGNGSEISAPIARKVFYHYFNSAKSKLANF
jgi:penicillin-binding protein 2